MLDMYSAVLSIAKANMFVEQIFAKFDTDKDGTIDFIVSCQKKEVTWKQYFNFTNIPVFTTF